MIPKLIYPGDDYDNEIENLNEKDEGLTYQEFEHHKAIPNNSEQNFSKVEISTFSEKGDQLQNCDIIFFFSNIWSCIFITNYYI